MSWCALLSVGPSSCSRDHSRASAMPLSPMTMMEMPTAASMYVENRSTLSAPLTAKASAPTSAWVDRGRGVGPRRGGGWGGWVGGGVLTMLAHRADAVAQAPVEPRVDGQPPAEETAASEVRVRARAKGRARESDIKSSPPSPPLQYRLVLERDGRAP